MHFDTFNFFTVDTNSAFEGEVIQFILTALSLLSIKIISLFIHGILRKERQIQTLVE